MQAKYFIKTAAGEVTGVSVAHLDDYTLVAIHQAGKENATVQILLSEFECGLLTQALKSHGDLAIGSRRPFRVSRSLSPLPVEEP